MATKSSTRKFGKMKDSFLLCRTVGHQWDERALEWRRKVTYINGKPIAFKCHVCTTERREVWSTTTGEMVYRTYDYPAGYSFTRSMVPADMTMRQAMRMEWLARQRAARAARKPARTAKARRAS